jgi:HK97 family phage portal protein
MSLLAQLMLGAMAGTPGPTDEFWYQPVDRMTAAGVRVDKDGAQKIAAWFRGREILACALAMLPLKIYQDQPNDAGPDVAPQHPLYDVIHEQPNVGEDAFTFWRERMYDLIDHGWGFAWITPGPRGFADQLLPLSATLVTPERLDTGRWLFHVRDPKTGRTTTRTQDEIFYLRGAEGKGILARARESLGTVAATEQYAGRIFGKGMLSGGFIEIPGSAGDEANKNIAKSLLTAPGDWHGPKVLPLGATFKANPLTPEDAQMLLSRKHSVDDVARWLGVPRLMLENNDPSFGNAEQFTQNFVSFSLGPWLSLFESAINMQLILAPRFYAEFTRDALVRGDLLSRWQAYQIQIQTGTRPRNEIRRSENLKKLDGLDEPIDPAFLSGGRRGSDAQPAKPAPNQPPGKPKPPVDGGKAQAIAQASASRLIRKEVATVQKLAVRHATDGDAFAAAVAEFYDKHADLVAQTLLMPEDEAGRYCTSQAAQIVAGDWMTALELWQTDHYAAGLAALALDEEAA